ncbi:hypothetical protein TWF730_003927 [Orbilia blumenaviensis]|uniref:Deoxyribonuclease NucA/NucB domain-containing protein n=1 Tax=Orbilia blumenaviensis TaxID=1796055 RepID=A0AAV9U231_9PEZI
MVAAAKAISNAGQRIAMTRVRRCAATMVHFALSATTAWVPELRYVVCRGVVSVVTIGAIVQIRKSAAAVLEASVEKIAAAHLQRDVVIQGKGLAERAGYECTIGTICCRAGAKLCGRDGCYDPETQVCCGSSGGVCNKGSVCAGAGLCCLSGRRLCGLDHCYDPSFQKCCTSGTFSWTCGTEATCGEPGTCPLSTSTWTLPTTTRSVLVTTTSTTTSATTSTTSPNTASTTTSTSASSTITTTSTTTSTTSRGGTTKERPCTIPTPNPPQTKTQTISFAYDPYRVSIPKEGQYSGQRVPHTNKAIIWNICKGIKNYNGGLGGNSLTLTHGGKCFQTWNHGEVCTGNADTFCRNGLNEYISSFYDSVERARVQAAITLAGGLTCVEFPFAASLEGGDLARGARLCVPLIDQSFQGIAMGRFFNPLIAGGDVIRPGEKYVVRIIGWDCDSDSPDSTFARSLPGVQKRDAFSAQGVSLVGDEMWRGVFPESSATNVMPMPLGDLDPGIYLVNLNITKGNANLTLIDYNGSPYDSSLNGNGGVTFQLGEEASGMILSGETFDDDLEVSYQAASITSTPFPSPTPSVASNHNQPPLYLLFVCIAFSIYTVIRR